MKRLCGVLLSLTAVTALCGADKEAKPAGDPAAEKLLADARAARAVWKDFPGFTADLEVNVDGKVAKGRVTVSSQRRGDAETAGRRARALGACGRWRRWSATAWTTAAPRRPCVFEDDNADHPLGRAVRVLATSSIRATASATAR